MSIEKVERRHWVLQHAEEKGQFTGITKTGYYGQYQPLFHQFKCQKVPIIAYAQNVNICLSRNNEANGESNIVFVAQANSRQRSTTQTLPQRLPSLGLEAPHMSDRGTVGWLRI